ncbi:MAG: hypothetical protein PHN42_01855 [Bacilli bacterium]|nr:hypothetical protein [Bacilli bacterium]
MDDILKFLKWQVILTMKRTLVNVEYRYNLNLKMIENMKKDDLFVAIKSRQSDNERLFRIKEETMNKLHSLFDIHCIDEMNKYLLLNYEIIIEILSTNTYLYELNLNNSYDLLSIYINEPKILYMLEILKKQKEYFQSNYTGFSDTIYKDLLNIIDLGDYSLIEIYDEIISSILYNPNIGGCGTSNEKFWCSLPSINCGIKNITKLNKKVILDKRTNYHLLSNGMSYINIYLEKSLNKSDYSLDEKLYSFNLINDLIRLNHCSILDTKFNDGVKQIEDNRFIKTIFFGDYQNEIIKLVKDLRNYLLSDEGISYQIDKIGLTTAKQNENIDLYISIINERNNVSSSLVKKLENMKR